VGGINYEIYVQIHHQCEASSSVANPHWLWNGTSKQVAPVLAQYPEKWAARWIFDAAFL